MYSVIKTKDSWRDDVLYLDLSLYSTFNPIVGQECIIHNSSYRLISENTHCPYAHITTIQLYLQFLVDKCYLSICYLIAFPYYVCIKLHFGKCIYCDCKNQSIVIFSRKNNPTINKSCYNLNECKIIIDFFCS